MLKDQVITADVYDAFGLDRYEHLIASEAVELVPLTLLIK